ncbi:hypothetical protein Patl1_33877 [Pistacia atlantica]|uniref:Uncharacterized protein n=1 Tax=Pistacia atlantica TaxID=434234 RepID=A0ACC0ZRI1_9ROSI|nr:hypothetical protein Patl1_33877 [Pistacia atlantica]
MGLEDELLHVQVFTASLRGHVTCTRRSRFTMRCGRKDISWTSLPTTCCWMLWPKMKRHAMKGSVWILPGHRQFHGSLLADLQYFDRLMKPKVLLKTWNRSITLSKLGHASEAHRLFCNMWSLDDRGDRDAYMSMLESMCSTGKTTKAMDMLSKIHEKGIGPDTIMYNTILSSLGRVGNIDEAVKVFEELENDNYKPDIISYNSLINCLGKNVVDLNSVSINQVKFEHGEAQAGLEPVRL